MKNFAVIGTGFWAKYQLSAWGEVDGAQCVAVCDLDIDKAKGMAAECNIATVYDDPNELFANEELDFVDIITPPAAHKPMVELAAKHKVSAICQKPLAESLEDAEQMVQACDHAGVRLVVHENFRWQLPLRALKLSLDSGVIGVPFRARLSFVNSFPIFDNQPGLADLEQFLLADIGVHVLDVARFLFGEAESLYCTTHRVNPKIKGEDVATVIMKMRNGITVVNEMSYTSRTKDEAFPQTFAFVEGSAGAAELVKDFWLHITTEGGTESVQHSPQSYPWANPKFDVVHSSLVPCNQNMLLGVSGGAAETTGHDNLKTLQLVYGSYDSVAGNRVVRL